MCNIPIFSQQSVLVKGLASETSIPQGARLGYSVNVISQRLIGHGCLAVPALLTVTTHTARDS